MLESAQDGDVITISEREKGIVTEASIKELATKKKIKLTLNKELGDFDGGIILSNNGIDKNMTLEVEIASIRDEYEARKIRNKEEFEEVLKYVLYNSKRC